LDDKSCPGIGKYGRAKREITEASWAIGVDRAAEKGGAGLIATQHTPERGEGKDLMLCDGKEKRTTNDISNPRQEKLDSKKRRCSLRGGMNCRDLEFGANRKRRYTMLIEEIRRQEGEEKFQVKLRLGKSISSGEPSGNINWR